MQANARVTTTQANSYLDFKVSLPALLGTFESHMLQEVSSPKNVRQKQWFGMCVLHPPVIFGRFEAAPGIDEESESCSLKRSLH